MQQLFAATCNKVSFEGGDINLWCPSYDESAKMALVRLFDMVFDYCQVDYARDSSGQIVPDEFQVGREEFERVIDDLPPHHLCQGRQRGGMGQTLVDRMKC